MSVAINKKRKKAVLDYASRYFLDNKKAKKEIMVALKAIFLFILTYELIENSQVYFGGDSLSWYWLILPLGYLYTGKEYISKASDTYVLFRHRYNENYLGVFKIYYSELEEYENHIYTEYFRLRRDDMWAKLNRTKEDYSKFKNKKTSSEEKLEVSEKIRKRLTEEDLVVGQVLVEDGRDIIYFMNEENYKNMKYRFDRAATEIGYLVNVLKKIPKKRKD